VKLSAYPNQLAHCKRANDNMQEGGKIVIAVSVTFTAGVITGWLLNTYTRKVGGKCHSR
jgi:hypothetical protein